MREAELPHDREMVEVDALAHELVTIEDEVRTHAVATPAARGWERTQRAQVQLAGRRLDP